MKSTTKRLRRRNVCRNVDAWEDSAPQGDKALDGVSFFTKETQSHAIARCHMAEDAVHRRVRDGGCRNSLFRELLTTLDQTTDMMKAGYREGSLLLRELQVAKERQKEAEQRVAQLECLFRKVSAAASAHAYAEHGLICTPQHAFLKEHDDQGEVNDEDSSLSPGDSSSLFGDVECTSAQKRWRQEEDQCMHRNVLDEISLTKQNKRMRPNLRQKVPPLWYQTERRTKENMPVDLVYMTPRQKQPVLSLESPVCENDRWQCGVDWQYAERQQPEVEEVPLHDEANEWPRIYGPQKPPKDVSQHPSTQRGGGPGPRPQKPPKVPPLTLPTERRSWDVIANTHRATALQKPPKVPTNLQQLCRNHSGERSDVLRLPKHQKPPKVPPLPLRQKCSRQDFSKLRRPASMQKPQKVPPLVLAEERGSSTDEWQLAPPAQPKEAPSTMLHTERRSGNEGFLLSQQAQHKEFFGRFLHAAHRRACEEQSESDEYQEYRTCDQHSDCEKGEDFSEILPTVSRMPGQSQHQCAAIPRALQFNSPRDGLELRSEGRHTSRREEAHSSIINRASENSDVFSTPTPKTRNMASCPTCSTSSTASSCKGRANRPDSCWVSPTATSEQLPTSSYVSHIGVSSPSVSDRIQALQSSGLRA